MKISSKAAGIIIILLFSASWLFGADATAEATPMKYTIGDFLKLLGSLGLFLFGMKFMSEGIQKAAGSKLRQVLRAVTSNRVFGVLTGLFVTTIIQSSSATTVMVVSFTNAGLFSLTESIGVIMGANIGTTITGWIVALFGLKVSVANLALPILGLSFPFMFFGNDKVKNWAEFAIGFALLFFGLGELKNSVPEISNNLEILAFIRDWSHLGFSSLLIFILIGTLLTIVVQSSSASMALTLVLLSKGWIDFPTAAAMVLGENIGTTITAQLAGLMANIHAKRAAMAHTVFNLIGVAWMLVLFIPFLALVEWIMSHTLGIYCNVFNMGCNADPSSGDLLQTANVDNQLAPVGLAVFHTAFNIINTLLLVWFIPQIEKIVIFILKKDRGQIEVLKYLSSGMLNTPELAVVEAQNELTEFGILTRKMFTTNLVILYRDSTKKLKKAAKKISAYEDECDQKETEIAKFLADLSMNSISKKTSTRIRNIWSIINDLERIGDLNEKIMLNLTQREEQSDFSNETVSNIREMTDKLETAYEMMINILDKEKETIYQLESIDKLESEINKLRDSLKNKFFIEIENHSISFQTGLLAVELITNFEKIADHIYNINSAMLLQK